MTPELLEIETVDLDGGQVYGEPQTVWIRPTRIRSIYKNRKTLNCWVVDLGHNSEWNVTRATMEKIVACTGVG